MRVLTLLIESGVIYSIIIVSGFILELFACILEKLTNVERLDA